MHDPSFAFLAEWEFRTELLMKEIISALFISLFLMGSSGFAAGADDILGLWNTQENKSKIEIFKCGNRYCGRIAELKEPNYPADDEKGMAGKPKVDRKNPDPDLRTHPLLGLQIMEGFSFSGSNSWEGGRIYDPDNGKTYKCTVTLSAPNRLEVRGFIGFTFLGRTSIWTR